ncbi:MAG: CotH kinase family protein, partial [Lachnospiraceae bacterium]|nr:CotH kinase family protein [Lachnospiraceae bacterium]
VYVRYLLHKLGYNDDRLYTHYGHDNTVTMDMLLGVRYLLSRDETLVHPGYEKLFDKGDTGVGVWRNPYALSAAIAVKDYDLSGITDIDNPYTLEGNPFDLQEDMLRRLTGEPAQVFVPADTEPAEGNGKKTLDLRIIPAVDGEVYMYLDGLMGTVQGLAVYLDDTLLAGYGNASSYKILNLGVHEAGKAFSVRVEGDSDEPDFGEPLFMTEDLQAVAAICDRLRGQEIAFSKDGNAGIRMTVPEGCGGIVTSVPFEEGWSVPSEKIYGALMYIPAEEVKKHTQNGVLTMRFLPKGMRTGLVVSVITLLLVLIWILRMVKENRRGGNPEKEEKERPAFKSGRTDGAGKIRAVRLLALAAAIAALGFLCARDSRAKEDHTYVRIGGQDIAVCQKEEQAFLFLPSWADPGELRLSEAVQSLHPEILRSEGLPALFINTVSGSLERVYADKEYREAGSIRAFDETGALVCAGGLESIKGRGNYSWMTQEWTKKPFTIRIGDDVPLLGQPAGGKYALLANASDDTLLRNDIGRALQVRMGMRFAERGTYTDLYINGEYMGVYYLCATTDLGSDRIDITKVSPSASGAYLLERELKERYELEWTEQTRGFVTDNEEYFVVRSPKYATEAEVEAIEAYITRAEAAILGESDARCTDYIDLDTFVKTYLTEELLKNYDGGVSSAYYYKDDADGKLYAAPGWDYDMSLGSYLDWMSHENPRTETQLYPYEGASSWFKTLYAGEQFRSMVQACYRMYREDFAQILRGRGETPGAVRGSAGGSDTESPANGRESGQLPLCEANYRMEYARWQEMYDARGEIPGSGAAFGRLEAFAAARMAFLDAIWITG